MRGAAGPGRLRHRILEAIADRGLWEPGARVAVAVSGGLDSVVLLDLLFQTRVAHGAQLEVVTVDHGTRPGSAGDADFVAGLAAGHRLPLHRFDRNLGPDASEDACRRARLEAFATLDADRIALAHHRDDQAETLLLHLLRGTGTRGLAGMRWRSERRVRPLLDTGRDEILAWAEHRGLAWREDPTNADPRFLRNRVRREVVPLLESLRPGAIHALARSAAVAAEDDAWLDSLVPDAPTELALDWVLSSPEALVGRTLQRLAPQTSQAAVAAVLSAARRGSGSVLLPGGGWWEVVALDGASKVVRFRSTSLPDAP